MSKLEQVIKELRESNLYGRSYWARKIEDAFTADAQEAKKLKQYDDVVSVTDLVNARDFAVSINGISITILHVPSGVMVTEGQHRSLHENRCACFKRVLEEIINKAIEKL